LIRFEGSYYEAPTTLVQAKRKICLWKRGGGNDEGEGAANLGYHLEREKGGGGTSVVPPAEAKRRVPRLQLRKYLSPKGEGEKRLP